MKTGVFGGTFDPIHLGHLRVAQEVRDGLGLDRVWFVPGNQPPHKPGGPVASATDRLEMARLATEGCPGFFASDLELKRGGPSYTVDTLRQMSEYGDELYFLLGIDAFLEIHTWKDFKELFSRAHFVVLSRPDQKGGVFGFDRIKDYAASELSGLLKPGPDGFLSAGQEKKVWFFECTALDISATAIRAALKKGKSIRFLAPEKVRQYILETEIYT